MPKSQGRALDRKKLLADPILVAAIIGIFLFLFLFILYPLAILLTDSVVVEKNINGTTLKTIGFANFIKIFKMTNFRHAISNTLWLGLISGIGSTVIGFLFAYVDSYVDVGSKIVKKLFGVVSILPVVSPPFVLSLSAILLFGRTGVITRGLFNMNNTQLYGWRGIALVQILTFFPVCYMMLKGLLKNIDPSLEEAARNMGAGRFKVFQTVTFPLLLPGIGNAFLVSFIESVADFANPMIIGGNFDTLATSIYLQLTGAYDKSGATAMAVVLLVISMGLFILEKYWLERKSVATLTGKATRGRTAITDSSVRIPLVTICTLLTVFVISMYILVPFGSLFKIWGRDYHLSLKWYEYIFKNKGYRVFTDSMLLSAIASPITAFLSMIIAYLVVKRKFFAKGFMEFVAMLAMAVPGTVLGVGFIRGYNSGLFHSGILSGLYGTGAILVIVFIVRSLPIGTRSGIAALRQIDRSIEEAAYDMGADSAKVFQTVTLPLIKESFISGLVTTFVRSITAISAIILLVTPKYLLITVRINEHAEKGNYGIACAYATILIVITYVAITIMNFVLEKLGTSKPTKEV
ncbi:MAG: iron ABC transporter permease [Treponema berlinense]|uniref:ABC transporter permease n=1 Tax=Treponema berlinense TaxID=225004 RepID=UPI002353AFDC|nr:iron ABC transporter permease [Treponema berlinense]MCI5542046.1 iron ABC transporter permease [Treponema berlinense]MDD5834275.1 iron ABC transporter permease [Treponema berlinense]MDY3708700.1 iron ABC transporter permease [Treponema berlinense]